MDKPPPPQKNGRRALAVSLSPRKTRKSLNSSLVVPLRTRIAREKSPNFGVALTKNETVLVTGTGDVLVARCRYSSKAYKARRQENDQDKRPGEANPDFWWDSADCRAMCNPCAGSGSPRMSMGKGGLLGGAPQLEVTVDSAPDNDVPPELTNDSADTPEKDEEDNVLSSEVDELGKDESAPITSASAPSNPPETETSNIDNVDDLDDLAVLPSFDYSHFAGEGNDMAPTPSSEMPQIREEEQRPEEKRQAEPEYRVEPPTLMHGVPVCLSAFHQVRITQVSANPLGSHVLLISAEALLFSFGLNNHGQLGHGYKSSEKGPSMGFVTKPSIVTPLLENGGKAVVCAAGIDYSLVVVKTDGRRIGRLQQPRDRSAPHRRGASESELPISLTRVSSMPPRIQADDSELVRQYSDDSVESLCHHQLYGFGRNDGRKLGLVDPSKRKKAEDVLLPRRVALNCNVWSGMEENDDGLPPPGIFAVAASSHHSAALVHRSSGAIEVYTWGDATFNALGPISGHGTTVGKGQNQRINGGFTPLPIAVTVPSVVKPLSHSATVQPSANDQGIIPVQVALGPTSTFVRSSTGKVFSFGKCDNGLLGQGYDVVMTDKPKQILFPSTSSRTETKISSISVGPSHAVAVTSNGRVYAWGKNEDCIMGFDSALRKHSSRGARRGASGIERSTLVHDEVEWIPTEIEIPVTSIPPVASEKKWIRKSSGSESFTNSIGAPPLSGDTGIDRVIQACAGYGMTVFVKDSGAVLSCGTGSGRLGLGETGTTSVKTPTPMFGGLYLWR